MKKIPILLLIGIMVLTGLTSCSSLLTKQATPNSIAVSSGLATTNDLAVVAQIRELQMLNKSLNPTQTSPLIDVALGGIAMMLSAFGGWYARHHTALAQIASANSNPNPPEK